MASTHKIDDQKELYFITLTVVDWIDVFTRDCYREIFINSVKFCQKNKSLEVGAWVLMTNHAHLIVRAGGKTRLEAIIRDMKSYISRSIRLLLENSSTESRKEWMHSIFKKTGMENTRNNDHQFWIQDYHPIKLANTTMLLQRLNYIHDNPLRAGFVTEPQHWKYSSAYDYCGGKQGLIDLIMLV
jgi:REP element-mobilizing transposase RayT